MKLKIRVFDTILEKTNGDTTGRNSADFWRPFCAASGWSFNYERVHSLEDINFFFGKPIKEEIIIFSGHGEKAGGFCLSNNEKIDGTQQINIHKRNEGKIIIFSSCSIGKNKTLADAIKSQFSAKNLFAYQHVVEDRFCFLNESILLTMMDHLFENGRKSYTENDFFDFTFSTDFMKNINCARVRNHPMLMF
jgi:hypothetical protein